MVLLENAKIRENMLSQLYVLRVNFIKAVIHEKYGQTFQLRGQTLVQYHTASMRSKFMTLSDRQ
jgi:hypothetical protein